MTIQIKPEQEQVIGAAIRAGLIVDANEILDAAVETIRRKLEAQPTETPHLSAEEWIRKFREWAHSHPTDTPLLSDEAISRESIYAERGL